LDDLHKVGTNGIEKLPNSRTTEGDASTIVKITPELNSQKPECKIEFEDLDISKEALGSGTSASVHKCIHTPTGRQYALKEISKYLTLVVNTF
jgi:hypothetical protein